MSLQADLTGFRWVRFPSVAARAGGPTDGTPSSGGSVPDFTMSPVAVSEMPTTGMLLQLRAPVDIAAATPGAGGFTVTVWFRDPITLHWSSFSAVSVAYNALFTTFDVDAGELWFQIGNVAVNGGVDVGIAEQ